MRAQVIEDYCEIPTFVLKEDYELPSSELQDNQVLVKVIAASVNPADNHLRNGKSKMLFKLTFPCVMGKDGSGIVTKIGAKVSKFQVGDSVCGCLPDAKLGTNAEYCIFDEIDLVKKPTEMTHQQASAFPVVGGTCIAMFREHPILASRLNAEIEKAWTEGKLSPPLEASSEQRREFKILILGASGGIGSVAVVFAKTFLQRYFNTKVYGVCSERNVGLVESLGADIVIDYMKTTARYGSQTTHPTTNSSDETLPSICQTIKNEHGDDCVDLVLDCVGGFYYYDDICRHFKLAGKAGESGGCVIASVVPPGPTEISLSALFTVASFMIKTKFNSWWWPTTSPSFNLSSFWGKCEKDFNFLYHHVLNEGRAFEKIPLTHFSLENIKEAHLLIASKRSVGKIIIDIQEP